MTPAEGLAWIEDGIANWGANGAILAVPYYLALKAEALYLAHRASEALGAIGEAETLVERSGERWWWAELHRLRGVFLTAKSAAETQIEASFCEAIRIAKEQKSVSLTKETRRVTCAKYRRQKESASGGRGFRLADFLQRPAMVPRSHGPQVQSTKGPQARRSERPEDQLDQTDTSASRPSSRRRVACVFSATSIYGESGGLAQLLRIARAEPAAVMVRKPTGIFNFHARQSPGQVQWQDQNLLVLQLIAR
jgi:hypothetical protein